MTVKIGTNIRRDASDPLDLVSRSGAQVVRVVPMVDVDLTDYLDALHGRGVAVLAVLAKESFGFGEHLDWGRVTPALNEYRRRYGALVSYWQVGNEWDMTSESSWTMRGTDLAELGRRVRNVFGPDTYLVVGGAADGAPADEAEERLSDLDLSWADAIAVHTYGQGVPGWTRDDGVTVLPFSPYNWTSTVRDLVDGYHAEAPDHALWITEHGFRWDELGEARSAAYAEAYLSYLVHRCPDVYAFTQFCLTDDQVPGFGLYSGAGHPHQAAAVFERYARLARDLDDDEDAPTPVPTRPMTVEEAREAAYRDLFLAGCENPDRTTVVYAPHLGIVKYWRDHRANLGSAVGPERAADDGSVFQSFACGIVVWDPASGASEVA